MNLWVIFITGLTVGGLTCLAVQGGLLASVITAREEEEIEKGVNTKNPFLPTLAFVISKLIAYTILGALLGAFGSAISINETVQTTMQFAAGIYMVLIALDLLQVHPIFKYAVIQPPRFLLRKVKNQSKSKTLFAPALLGAFTIFIPCGTTLAMEALAISSANMFSGAAIMAVFVLGTTPLFFGVGWLTSVLGDSFRHKFIKIAAVAVLYLGIMSINGALTVFGSPITLQSIFSTTTQSQKQASQNIQIFITPHGYSPRNFTIKKGVPVQITLISKDTYSCASAFRIPSLGVSINLKPSDKQTIIFTPQHEGVIPFTCSMGMYSGAITVL